MTQTVDVVVAGAGHNSLITAAYLAETRVRVLVLGARAVPLHCGKVAEKSGDERRRIPPILKLPKRFDFTP